MSVLIYMEMPTRCDGCPIADTLCCPLMPGVPALWAEYASAVKEKRLHSDCPLVPVPPHGRLVDADALVKMFKEKAAEYGGLGGIIVALAAACIDAAPTIIAAEKGECDG